MAACGRPVTFVVLGAGPDRDALVAHATSLGLLPQLRLLDPRPPAAVAEVMNALDVLVLMSRTARTWKEQFGRVIMEAQACGVPVIGSNSGSIPGVVAEGGWIVPEGRSAPLAELLGRLMASPEEVERARAAGLDQARGRFSVRHGGRRARQLVRRRRCGAPGPSRGHGQPGAVTVKPRVLLVSPVSEFKGGAEVVLRTMLANPHIEPVLALPEEGPIEQAARAMGVPVCFYRPSAMLHVHRPPRPGPIAAAVADAFRCSRRLRRLAREHGCPILHSNGLKPHMLLALLGSSARVRTLVHLHDIPYRRSERVSGG